TSKRRPRRSASQSRYRVSCAWRLRSSDGTHSGLVNLGEVRYDLLAEELHGLEGLLVLRSVGVAEAHHEVVGAELLVPLLDLLDAVIGGAHDEAVRRHLVEGELVG